LPKSSNKWVLAFFSVLLAAAPVHAQATKNFYEGKIISYYVGSTAGGGNDITSRHIARHFEGIFRVNRVSISSINQGPAV